MGTLKSTQKAPAKEQMPDLATAEVAKDWLPATLVQLKKAGFETSTCPNARIAALADWQVLQGLKATKVAAAAAAKVTERQLSTVSVEKAMDVIGACGLELSARGKQWLQPVFADIKASARTDFINSEDLRSYLALAIYHAANMQK